MKKQEKQIPHVVVRYKGKSDVSHTVYPSEKEAKQSISEKIKGLTSKLLTQDQYFKMFNEGKFEAGKNEISRKNSKSKK